MYRLTKSSLNVFLNDRLLIGPSLVCNFCVFFFYLVYKCHCIVSCHIGLFMHVCCLNFNKVSVSVIFFAKFQSQFDSLYLSVSEVSILSVFSVFFHVSMLPVMVNKDVYNVSILMSRNAAKNFRLYIFINFTIFFFVNFKAVFF